MTFSGNDPIGMLVYDYSIDPDNIKVNTDLISGLYQTWILFNIGFDDGTNS